MNPEEACSVCGGRKVVLVQVAVDWRTELGCPACGGTGLAVDQTANVLSGQIEDNAKKLKEADLEPIKRRFATFQVQ